MVESEECRCSGEPGACLAAVALAAVGVAAFVCDSAGRVQALTPDAEQALARGVLRLRQDALAAAREPDTRELEDAVAHAASARGAQAPARTLVLRDPDDHLRLEVLDVIPLPDRAGGAPVEPRALVVVRGVRREDAGLPEVLRLAFALTPAEADIAMRLLEGDSREAIAAARGASIETVRSQVKALFAKLAVSRVGELAARLARLR